MCSQSRHLAGWQGLSRHHAHPRRNRDPATGRCNPHREATAVAVFYHWLLRPSARMAETRRSGLLCLLRCSGRGLVRTVPILEKNAVARGCVGRPASCRHLGFIRLARSRAHGAAWSCAWLARNHRRSGDAGGDMLSGSLKVGSLIATIDLIRADFGATILPFAPIHARVKAGELVPVPLMNPGRALVGDSFASVPRELVASGTGQAASSALRSWAYDFAHRSRIVEGCSSPFGRAGA